MAWDLFLQSQLALNEAMSAYQRLGEENRRDAFDVQKELKLMHGLLLEQAQTLERALGALEAWRQDIMTTVECGRVICVNAEEALSQVEQALAKLDAVKLQYLNAVAGTGQPATEQVKSERTRVLASVAEVDREALEAREVLGRLEKLIGGSVKCREGVQQAMTTAEPHDVIASEQFRAGNAPTTLNTRLYSLYSARSEYQEALEIYGTTAVTDCDPTLVVKARGKLDAVQAAIGKAETDVTDQNERAGDLVGEAQIRWRRLPAYSAYWPFGFSELSAIERLYDEALPIYQEQVGDPEATHLVLLLREDVRARASRLRTVTLGYAGGLAAVAATGTGLAAWRLRRLHVVGRDRRTEDDLF
jgi:tetratricopeptide (TPR) repeat protein